jgi:hypothetical protein
MSHNIGLESNYYRPREDQILSEYLKAVDALTIHNENRLQRKVMELEEKQNDKVAKLEQEVHELRMLMVEAIEKAQTPSKKLDELDIINKKRREKYATHNIVLGCNDWKENYEKMAMASEEEEATTNQVF